MGRGGADRLPRRWRRSIRSAWPPILHSERRAAASPRRRARRAARTFGHADFRGLQAGVIGEVLAGRNALAVLPTGGGKSLCYQIPSLMRPGLGLVVSPLIALMTDQVAALQQSGVAAERLDSNIEPRRARRHLAADRGGRAGPALRLARRPDAAVDAGAAVAAAAGADRHRRGALRQPVGPRFPARVPHAGPAGRAVPRACRGWPSPPPPTPARARTSAPSCGSGRRGRVRRQLRAARAGAVGRAQARQGPRARAGAGGRAAGALGRGLCRLARRRGPSWPRSLSRRGRPGARLSRRPRQGRCARRGWSSSSRPTRR